MSRNKHTSLVFLLALCSTGLFSCAKTHHVAYVYAYGTNWEVHLYEGSAQDKEDIASFVRKTSQLIDPNASAIPDGVYALNQGNPVQLDPFVSDALKRSQEYEKKAEGGLCFRLGALTRLWEECLKEKTVPSKEERFALLLDAEETSVTEKDGYTQKIGDGEYDLGALGKGLCLEYLKDILKEKGITDYFINGGTSSLLFGKRPVKVYLDDAPGKSFAAQECAVATSSNSRESTVINGVTYSHVIDPKTGEAKTPYDACCLKGNDAAELDAYATAGMVLGSSFLNSLENVEYALIKGGQVVDASQGFLE